MAEENKKIVQYLKQLLIVDTKAKPNDKKSYASLSELFHANKMKGNLPHKDGDKVVRIHYKVNPSTTTKNVK